MKRVLTWSGQPTSSATTPPGSRVSYTRHGSHKRTEKATKKTTIDTSCVKEIRNSVGNSSLRHTQNEIDRNGYTVKGGYDSLAAYE